MLSREEKNARARERYARDAEFREQKNARARERWASDPQFRADCYERWASPEYRAKNRAWRKTEAFRERKNEQERKRYMLKSEEHNERDRRRYAEDEEFRARALARASKPERRERKRKRYADSPEVRAQYSANHRARLFNVTRDDIFALLEKQGGCCALCERTDPGHARGWFVDHDHELAFPKGERWRGVRGIVCYSCNSWLGGMGDSVKTMVARNREVVSLLTRYFIDTFRATQQYLAMIKISGDEAKAKLND